MTPRLSLPCHQLCTKAAMLRKHNASQRHVTCRAQPLLYATPARCNAHASARNHKQHTPFVPTEDY
eukprot:12006495-Alexandrium_andersonii.AAC.1